MPGYAETAATIDVKVVDVTQQKVRAVENLSPDVTASELVNGLLDELNIPRMDPEGRSLAYRALLRREGRHLRPNERIGDRVQNQDTLVLHPFVEAG
jgi:hypothetical protein